MKDEGEESKHKSVSPLPWIEVISEKPLTVPKQNMYTKEVVLFVKKCLFFCLVYQRHYSEMHVGIRRKEEK